MFHPALIAPTHQRMVPTTRQVLICRVRNSVTSGNRWVTSLGDYLKETGKSSRSAGREYRHE